MPRVGGRVEEGGLARLTCALKRDVVAIFVVGVQASLVEVGETVGVYRIAEKEEDLVELGVISLFERR